MPGVHGGAGAGINPSNLHLKKELTQIRKAARVLRDPGTTSSWRSPLSSSARSALAAAGNCSLHHHAAADGDAANGGIGNHKDKKVFLHNWQRSSSEKSAAKSLSEESQSDARIGGGDDRESKGDTYDRYASMIFRCKGSSTTHSIRRNSVKKKSRKSNAQLANALRQQVEIRSSKQALDGLVGHEDDSTSLVEQSDDTEEYCNSNKLRGRVSAKPDSPLLSRIRQKNWSHLPSKFLRNSGKDDSSYTYNSTPALSTSSYNRYFNRNPSTVGSWDDTTVSFNDADDEVDDPLDLPGRQGCGIPCYWSKRVTPRHRGSSGSCYSPSFSDTLRRKTSNIYRRHSSSASKNRMLASRISQGVLPLLTKGGSSVGTGCSDDELSTNYGEIDLEAVSRLDGRRWSTSCRSQEGLEIVAMNGEEEGSTPENLRSLSQKYKPLFFEELIGQNIVVQSLKNGISRGRLAPAYLFQGPRGTGKSSTARIFASALNCLATEETKPCGVCRECADFISGNSKDFMEVDSTSKKGIGKVRQILRSLGSGSAGEFSRYKIFIIDECHLLPYKTWLAFLKFLEEPPPRVVFIFVLTDLENVPRTVSSRCQKYIFNKIKDSDILYRLRKISADEGLDVEAEALDLIALNSDGSLRDAETMLDQMSLLGKKITSALVNELVGVVSDEKLLELLELAMSSETAETVKRARELMDSGVDPIVVMSQLATLIMDIIAGTDQIIDSNTNGSFIGAKSLTQAELDRLKHALKLLSDAEKQLRVSSERSTWFTATLLQLGSVCSSETTYSGSSRRQVSKTTDEDPSSASKEVTGQKQRTSDHCSPQKLTPSSLSKSALNEEERFLLSNVTNVNSKRSQSQIVNGNTSSVLDNDARDGSMVPRCKNLDKLDDIWLRCIENCHSKTLQQLLLTHGKLISISEVKGLLIVYVIFEDEDVKVRVERFLSSITNSFETVLRSNVEVRIIHLPGGAISIKSGNKVSMPDSFRRDRMEPSKMTDRETKAICSDSRDGSSVPDLHQDPLKFLAGSFDNSANKLGGIVQSASGSPISLVEGNAKVCGTKERIPMQRIESIIREQRLETAWLQAVEKGTPGSLNRLKPEKNQILPQEGICNQNQMDFIDSKDFSQPWENELNRELELLKISEGKEVQKNQIGKRIDLCPISPSLLHNRSGASNFSKESMGYESGTGARGCSGLFCWNAPKPRKRAKIKQRTPVRSHKGVGFSWLGECAKPRKSDQRLRR